ncbi:MAG: HD domain-containing protein [Melioribacteraceae bacterium]|nr:HD domain-containing protein [Melioribacteraceae bacterium]
MINLKEHIENYKFLKIASEIAAEQNVEIYIVGGYVRDIVLQRERNDIDILVIGNGPDFAKLLAAKLGSNKVVEYKNYGTAHFKYDNLDLEFVGARKESYNRESRNPNVEIGTFEDDINRRDFTINAIALSLNKDSFGDVIDRFNGMEDIEKKIIKTPLNPEETFDDDPLRILRAFRFAAQLEFEVDEVLMKSAENLAERLKIISVERITDEFLKIMASPKPSVGLKLLYDTGVMKVIFPEVAKLGGVDQRKDFHHKDVFLHTCEVIDNLSKVSDDVWLRFAALMHDIAKPNTKRFDEEIGWTFHGHEEIGARMQKGIFRRLKLPFTKLEYLQKLVRLHLRPIALVNEEVSDSAIRRFVVAAGEDLEDLIKLCRADITSKNESKVKRYLNNYEVVMQKVRDVKEKDKLREFQSPVRGEEIMSVCNIKPCKTVGLIKTAIEEAILDGVIPNEYEAAYEYFMKIKDGYL